MHSCYSATYNHASWNGYYNGDWYYFDYLPSSETHKRDGAEDENLAIYHLKRRFFNKHPTGIVRHSRIPDVFLYKRSERRAIAVWYKGIIGVNYDKNGDYISWHIA